MNNLSEVSPNVLAIVSNTESIVARLLPLLTLLETPEQPDRIAQLLELLGLILDAQHQQATALKDLATGIDRLPRR